MPSETITHFYNEIVFFAAKIGELGLPDKFIEAAKNQEREKIEGILDQSETEYPEFWERLLQLYSDYEKAGEPGIFCAEESEEYFKYNPEEIDPLNLCFVLMLSEGNMTDVDVFVGNYWEYLPVALMERGYNEMAYEANNELLGSLIENLMRAFS